MAFLDTPEIVYLGSSSNQDQLKNADHMTEESKDEPLVNQRADQDRIRLRMETRAPSDQSIVQITTVKFVTFGTK
jgi:hypothetical protein